MVSEQDMAFINPPAEEKGNKAPGTYPAPWTWGGNLLVSQRDSLLLLSEKPPSTPSPRAASDA